MRTGATMARVNERIQGWLLSEEGREALEQPRVSLMRTGPAGGSGTRLTVHGMQSRIQVAVQFVLR
jgi:hypothetical protein